MTGDFWAWVASRRAHQDPRGDFIRDTRDLLAAGIDPSTRIGRACGEARREHEKLRREWEAL